MQWLPVSRRLLSLVLLCYEPFFCHVFPSIFRGEKFLALYIGSHPTVSLLSSSSPWDLPVRELSKCLQEEKHFDLILFLQVVIIRIVAE